jgi:hypothetical protein
MKYDWKKIINQNSGGRKYYSDCQVVTAVNAYYLLTGEQIKQRSKRYKELCELAKACYGSAICIKKVWKELGIEVFNESFLPMNDDYPTECSVWHLRYGYHSVLICDYSEKCSAYRVANLRWHTSMNGWIFEEDLISMLAENPSKSEPRYRTRQFRCA